MGFLSGYKTYIAGAGTMIIGVGEAALGISAGLCDGCSFDGAMISSGLTKITAGLGMIGARAVINKITGK